MVDDSEIGSIISQDIDARKPSQGYVPGNARARLVVFPVCAVAIVLLLADPALVSPNNPLHRHAPLLALCSVVIHILLQATSIPPTIGYAAENSIIFIDFVGETMKLPPQLCDTMEAFTGHVAVMFSRKDRKGWSFVRTQEYEIIESSSSSALTPSTWSTLVKAGAKIQLGVVLRRMGARVTCPYCSMEVFARPVSESRDSHLCEGCRRYFEASTVQAVEPGSQPSPYEEERLRGSDTVTAGTMNNGHARVAEALSNEDQQEQRYSLSGTRHSKNEPGERIEDFDCVHILYFSMFALPNSAYPSTNFLTLGYVTMSMGHGDAFRLFNIYTRSQDCRDIGIHFCLGDNSYRRLMPDGQLSDVALCYKPDSRGAVVQQSMWQPAQRGDIQRHVDDATLLPPVFFVRPSDFVKGLPLSYVLNTPPGSLFDISNSNAPALLGGLTNTHFCLMWPGYPEYRKQVELRNASGAPITMSKLAERIARFVERFIENTANRPIDGPWRIGQGGITKDHIFIVGINQVSRGVWQPILQLNYFNTIP